MPTVPADVQLGDFFCVFTGSEVSKLVTIGEWLNGDRFSQTKGRKFSHAGIVVETSPVVRIIEAEPGGVRYASWHYTSGCVAVWSTGVLAPVDRSEVVAAALRLRGTPYGWPNYPAIGAHRLHIPVPYLTSYVSSDRSVICSQVVDLTWRAGGTILKPGELPGFVTPQQLADLAMAAGAQPLHGA